MLRRKTHYLQIALNSTLYESLSVLGNLPVSDRILIEAGTPLIKEYGGQAISSLRSHWQKRLLQSGLNHSAYIVADLKCMDRGEREVSIAAESGASAAVALGIAPVETLNTFIAFCKRRNIDSMVDMMNVDKPYRVLRKIKTLPDVVILHRGVDEERDSSKLLPIHMINKVKGAFDTIVSVAGGDTPREVQSAAFNGADIVVVWKNFYQSTEQTSKIAEEFLRKVK